MAFALDFFPNFERSWPDRPGLLEGVACRRATARGGGRDVARILQGVRSLQRKRAAARVRGHVNRRAPGRSGRWRCARAATRSARVGLAARTPRRASWTPHSRALRRSARPATPRPRSSPAWRAQGECVPGRRAQARDRLLHWRGVVAAAQVADVQCPAAADRFEAPQRGEQVRHCLFVPVGRRDDHTDFGHLCKACFSARPAARCSATCALCAAYCSRFDAAEAPRARGMLSAGRVAFRRGGDKER